MNDSTEEPIDRRPIPVRNTGWAQAITRLLIRVGATPNGISVFGMLAAIAAGVLLSITGCDCSLDRVFFLLAPVLILVRLLANMFDGMVAVESGTTSPIGELFNEAPDRISDAIVLIGAGYAVGGDVLFGYGAACVALFVAYVRSLAKSAGAPSDYRGPLAKQQRMWAVMIASVYMGAAPSAWQSTWGPQDEWGIFSIALIVVIVGGAFTAARRLRGAAKYLRKNSESYEDAPVGC